MNTIVYFRFPRIMGAFLSVLSEQLPPKSKFVVEDIPDLSGKVIIVTGGNTGQATVFDSHLPLMSCSTSRYRLRNSQSVPLLNIPCELNQAFNQALLLHNAKTYLAARNSEKATNAIAKLKAETGKEAIFLKLDLADLKAIKSAAAEFNRYGVTISRSFFKLRCNAVKKKSYTSFSTTGMFSQIRLV